MRGVLALPVLLVLLSSGCISSGTDPSPTPILGPAPAEDPAPVPVADVAIQESVPMTTGLEATTWRFEVAAGGTGHVYMGAHDLVTGMFVLGPDACIEYTIVGPRGTTKGNEGSDCSTGNLVIQSPGAGAPRAFLDWTELPEGRYSLTARGQPQPNELRVDIVVDNP